MHGLDRALDPVEEDAFAVWLLDERQAIAPGTQPPVAPHESYSPTGSNSRNAGIDTTRRNFPEILGLRERSPVW